MFNIIGFVGSIFGCRPSISVRYSSSSFLVLGSISDSWCRTWIGRSIIFCLFMVSLVGSVLLVTWRGRSMHGLGSFFLSSFIVVVSVSLLVLYLVGWLIIRNLCWLALSWPEWVSSSIGVESSDLAFIVPVVRCAFSGLFFYLCDLVIRLPFCSLSFTLFRHDCGLWFVDLF